MNDTIQKKLISKRKSLSKKLLQRLSEAPKSKDQYFNMEYLFASHERELIRARDFLSGHSKRQTSLLGTGSMVGSFHIMPHIAKAFVENDHDRLALYYSYMIGRDYLVQQLSIAMNPDVIIFSGELTELTMGLYAIGWPDEAGQIMRQVWEHPEPPRALLLFPDYLMVWFAIYFTLGSRDLIARAKFRDASAEPNEPDSPYSFLLGCWKDADPAKVRNSLVAYSEQNMARSLLGENKRTETGFDIDSWWYVPWDILAIQMRRKALGLDWVETDDARMHEVWQNREELPFVKDDLVWPTYLELCDLLRIEPYKPRKSVEVRINRENFDFEVVS